MTAWKDIAEALGLTHTPFPVSTALHQGAMDGERDGYRIQVWQLDEYRRATRTGITLSFDKPLGIGLSMTSSAGSRARAHWLWGAAAGLLFCAGLAGALAAWHPGPLLLWTGSALLLWSWLAERAARAGRESRVIASGDPALDGLVHVEAGDREAAASRLGDPCVREALHRLADGDRELEVSDGKISLRVSRVIGSVEDFEKELRRMTELAGRLNRRPP
ncbi:MAG TPA: hypothetical protein VM285_03400 [Polyangia bacterium]|nr:hypothetical protein [Polyangia bacterium]